ncbi:MAG: hypothetical protein RMJ53_05915, partial [Chitinophagales bacterium]|nr:hypothetical protein [Chitinophagales bacterium]MDW8273747.1 hypothetical protein [Chitinophagales bacterium]
AKLTCNFIVVDTLKVYPGTPLYDRYKDRVTFSLYPYVNKFTDEKLNEKAEKHRQLLYREFYLRLSVINNLPKRTLLTALTKDSILLKYVWKRAGSKLFSSE